MIRVCWTVIYLSATKIWLYSHRISRFLGNKSFHIGQLIAQRIVRLVVKYEALPRAGCCPERQYPHLRGVAGA